VSTRARFCHITERSTSFNYKVSQKAAASDAVRQASAGDLRPPGANRVPPIDPVKHVSQLRGGDRDHPIARRGPDKPAALQPLGVKRHADPVVPDDLEQIPSGPLKT
jgi:hypothetical protein